MMCTVLRWVTFHSHTIKFTLMHSVNIFQAFWQIIWIQERMELRDLWISKWRMMAKKMRKIRSQNILGTTRLRHTNMTIIKSISFTCILKTKKPKMKITMRRLSKLSLAKKMWANTRKPRLRVQMITKRILRNKLRIRKMIFKIRKSKTKLSIKQHCTRSTQIIIPSATMKSSSETFTKRNLVKKVSAFMSTKNTKSSRSTYPSIRYFIILLSTLSIIKL